MVHVPDRQPPQPHAAASVATVEELAQVLRGLRRREARQREGAELTYRQLAAKAGWSHAVVAAYLTGKILPPTDRFDTLVQLLGASRVEQGELATARDRVEENRRPARAGRPGRAAGNGLPPPRQLPADVPGFTGRDAALTELDRLPGLARRGSAVPVAAVTGTAGVGKTALAVHWAHRVKSRFSHGQLYADLGGYGPSEPASPEQILDGLLVGLGVSGSVMPRGVTAKAALYRSLLDRRRVLVLLDNAETAAQVRPLLPAEPGCLVVVTSRNQLTGLVARDGANRICLDPLLPSEALALLAEIIGGQRVAAEPAAVRQLARLCGYLPVVLCAAGEQAAARAGSLRSLVADLAAAPNLLDLLDGDDRGETPVRTAFSWSYRRLPADAARLFRLLGRYPAGAFDRLAAAALAGTDPGRAARLIDVLVAANLLCHEPGDRYRLPGLLRDYAADLSQPDTPPN